VRRLAHTAYAQDAASCPPAVGGGENSSIEYGPGPRGNIVGGGLARVVGNGENTSIEYEGPVRTQTRLFAHVIGAGGNTSII
jgi:hypothetical protein